MNTKEEIFIATAKVIPAHTVLAPPPGAPEGGIWGKNKYVGGTTQVAACVGCLCCGIPGIFILCFPIDERDAYMVNNKIYDACGAVIGMRPDVKFIPIAAHHMER